MPIPKEILSVPRPKNTVVVAYGKHKHLYAVRQRTGCRYVGGRHLPVTGPTIGHIVDGQYVALSDRAHSGDDSSSAELKDWANIVLCDRLFSDIIRELTTVYNHADAMKIYCIAILRVCHPGIEDDGLKETYETSFLSVLYPGVALSKSTVCRLLPTLGKTVTRIIRFMRNRVAAVPVDHHLLIAGTLKSNDSKVNSLSDFSRETSPTRGRALSVIYAFDLDAMEPICSEFFPGDMSDDVAYEAFLEDNEVTRGIIVADKGFPESAVHRHIEANPSLHYLNPLERDSELIPRHNMLDFTGILPGYDGIIFRKEKCTETDRWLYSFRDGSMAAEEEQKWLRRAGENGDYSLDTLREKQREFGTIVLESGPDLPAQTVYKAYKKRREIDLGMRFYKSACQYDEERVQDDYSVIGSEFCDFLATLLTFRLLKAFDQAHLLKSRTYKQLMSVLARAKKIRSKKGGWQLLRMLPAHVRILQNLELLPEPQVPEEKRRGRPKGRKIAPPAAPLP